MTTHPATPDQSNPVGKTPEALRCPSCRNGDLYACTCPFPTTRNMDSTAGVPVHEGSPAELTVTACYFPGKGEVDLTWKRNDTGDRFALTVPVTDEQGETLAKVVYPCINWSASAPQAGAESYPPSDAMVDAYLQAQRAAVEKADRFLRIGGLHTNTVREACRDGLSAALRARGAVPSEPLGTVIGNDAVSEFTCSVWAGSVPPVGAYVYAAAPAAPMSAQPSDEEILEAAADFRPQPHFDQVGFAREVLARWGAAPGSGVEQDAARLDFIGRNRVALIPEFEGGWEAQIYEEDAEPYVVAGGMTVRGAIDAAMAANGQEGGA